MSRNANGVNNKMEIDKEDLERGSSWDNHHPHFNGTAANHHPLSKVVSIDAELFEKLYLGPKTEITGSLRTTFANPTPVALLGFSVGLLPITTAYMGWRSAGAGSADAQGTTAATLWFGGLLLIIAGVGEWILGNFFPFCVFMGYGAHFLTLGTTFIPFYNALASYTDNDSQTITPHFAATFGFYTLALALLSFGFLLGSFRTNAVFVVIFVAATTGFGLATGGFWQITNGNVPLALKLFKGTGAAFFAADMLGWYLFFGSIIALMELPIPDLPVFDLSTVIKAKRRGVEARAEENPAQPAHE